MCAEIRPGIRRGHPRCLRQCARDARGSIRLRFAEFDTSCEKLTVPWLAFAVLAKTANVTRDDSATALASILGLDCQYAPPGPRPPTIDVADGKAALGWTIVAAAVRGGTSIFGTMGGGRQQGSFW